MRGRPGGDERRGVPLRVRRVSRHRTHRGADPRVLVTPLDDDHVHVQLGGADCLRARSGVPPVAVCDRGPPPCRPAGSAEREPAVAPRAAAAGAPPPCRPAAYASAAECRPAHCGLRAPSLSAGLPAGSTAGPARGVATSRPCPPAAPIGSGRPGRGKPPPTHRRRGLSPPLAGATTPRPRGRVMAISTFLAGLLPAQFRRRRGFRAAAVAAAPWPVTAKASRRSDGAPLPRRRWFRPPTALGAGDLDVSLWDRRSPRRAAAVRA